MRERWNESAGGSDSNGYEMILAWVITISRFDTRDPRARLGRLPADMFYQIVANILFFIGGVWADAAPAYRRFSKG